MVGYFTFLMAYFREGQVTGSFTQVLCVEQAGTVVEPWSLSLWLPSFSDHLPSGIASQTSGQDQAHFPSDISGS